MGPAPATHTPGFCEDKARLECSYKEAEAGVRHCSNCYPAKSWHIVQGGILDA